MMSAMTVWRENGRAPERIVASHSAAGKVDRTRPLCAYPLGAKYKGAGSIDEADNFTCEVSK
jgi:feruloyl esterase